jgi:hypothetical protein
VFFSRLRIINYKGFDDSGWIEFGRGFNVIVGPNNSGKTALTEALRMRESHNRPYLSARQLEGEPLPARSVCEFDVEVNGRDLRNRLFATEERWVGVPVLVPDHGQARQTLAVLFGDNQIAMSLVTSPGSLFSSRVSPSHQLFADSESPYVAVIFPRRQTNEIEFGHVANGGEDIVPALALHVAQERTFVFRAERMNLGRVEAQETSILSQDARNLPAALMHLAGNPTLWDEYNSAVTAILPNVRRVVVFPRGNEFEVRLWLADPATKRRELAVPLSESGTGVGQVLAILYVAMTLPRSVIAIDEPNSFLHPGATKKLIQILRQFPHQYIVTTHSAEVIAAAEPSTLTLVRWDGERSVVEQRSGQDVQVLRQVLLDLGTSLSDVFGADRVIWVEGPTEEECFPKIARHRRGKVPLGLSIVAVRATGDLEASGGRAKMAYDIYRKLSQSHPLLPTATAFSFDREGRSETAMADLVRESQGAVHFLPWAIYENYLLHPKAIAACLGQDRKDTESGAGAEDEVRAWFAQNAGKYNKPRSETVDPDDRSWHAECNGPRLLSALFDDLARIPFGKTRHSVWLTEWILANDPDWLAGLLNYVEGLVWPEAPESMSTQSSPRPPAGH